MIDLIRRIDPIIAGRPTLFYFATQTRAPSTPTSPVLAPRNTLPLSQGSQRFSSIQPCIPSLAQDHHCQETLNCARRQRAAGERLHLYTHRYTPITQQMIIRHDLGAQGIALVSAAGAAELFGDTSTSRGSRSVSRQASSTPPVRGADEDFTRTNNARSGSLAATWTHRIQLKPHMS